MGHHSFCDRLGKRDFLLRGLPKHHLDEEEIAFMLHRKTESEEDRGSVAR